MLLALPSSAGLLTTTPAAIRPVLRPRAALLATRTAIGPADLVSEPTSTASGSAAFSWEANWYPVMPLSYADPVRPNGFTLLGKHLVLWKSADGWACVEDACPHRLAPLSTGRVMEEGTLMCRFHGWRFDDAGNCVEGPNADAGAAASLCGAPETCATSYPVQEVSGLLWVWPEAGLEGLGRSLLEEPAALGSGAQDWVMTVPPVSYESMVENSMDPSHAPHLHEGTFAASDMVPLTDYSAPAEPLGDEGFTVAHGGYTTKNDGMKATRTFRSPSFVDVNYELPSGKQQNFQLFFVPSTPFETRVITGLGLPQLPAWLPKRELLADLLHAFFFSRSALWRFNDQDRLVMQGQDRNQAADPDRRQAAWDVATPSDTGVSTFRKWLAEVGGGGPFASSGAAASLPTTQEEVSRWNVHGKHCPSCKRALALLEGTQAALGKMALFAAVAAAALAVAGRLASGIVATAAAVALSAGSRWAAGGRAAFFWMERELWLPQVYAR